MSDVMDFSLDRHVQGKELFDGPGQLARTTWLAKRIREDDFYFLQDGVFSQLLFKEVLSTFIAGQYIATIVLAFSLIERTVAGRLAHMGDISAAKAKSEKLLKVALEKSWITTDEHAVLDRLRELRNPIVHFRDHLDQTRPEVRAALSARTTKQVLESDAKQILESTIHVLKKTAI